MSLLKGFSGEERNDQRDHHQTKRGKGEERKGISDDRLGFVCVVDLCTKIDPLAPVIVGASKQRPAAKGDDVEEDIDDLDLENVIPERAVKTEAKTLHPHRSNLLLCLVDLETALKAATEHGKDKDKEFGATSRTSSVDQHIVAIHKRSVVVQLSDLSAVDGPGMRLSNIKARGRSRRLHVDLNLCLALAHGALRV